MKEFLLRILSVIDEYRIHLERSDYALYFYAAILIFGVLNCILGYRLIRFWMMLAGFAGGAVVGYLFAGEFGITEEKTALIVAVLTGTIIAIVTFLAFRVGLLLGGSLFVASVAVILIHPTTSAMFFLCLLLGVIFGFLIFKYTREMLIVVTALFGGVLSGLSLARILDVSENTYGLLLAALFTMLSIVIQMLLNKPEYEEEYPEEKTEDIPYDAPYDESYDESYDDRYDDRYDDPRRY